MSKNIYRSFNEPDRQSLRYEERFLAEDQGLITCLEVGRRMRLEHPELAKKAMRGELPPMGWKGGVEKPKPATRFGTLFYLAQWQGIRGEDLNIDLDEEPELTCTATGVKVIFTGDRRKYCTTENSD
ncbi:MAG: hypothetical protein JXD19_05685 [Deltaproteobacteria bacterium]|nr:hypothetical protein [Deltaproteobacteria bacterium]